MFSHIPLQSERCPVSRSTTPVINDDVSNQSHTSYTNQLDKSKHYHDEILCEELDLLIKKKI